MNVVISINFGATGGNDPTPAAGAGGYDRDAGGYAAGHEPTDPSLESDFEILKTPIKAAGQCINLVTPPTVHLKHKSPTKTDIDQTNAAHAQHQRLLAAMTQADRDAANATTAELVADMAAKDSEATRMHQDRRDAKKAATHGEKKQTLQDKSDGSDDEVRVYQLEERYCPICEPHDVHH